MSYIMFCPFIVLNPNKSQYSNSFQKLVIVEGKMDGNKNRVVLEE